MMLLVGIAAGVAAVLLEYFDRRAQRRRPRPVSRRTLERVARAEAYREALWADVAAGRMD